MQSSLLPERPLIISPTLAATIGLEEAVMLHVLAELMAHRETRFRDGLTWLELDQDLLCQSMPFWSWVDIRRVQKSLQDLGLIVNEAAGQNRFSIAINQAQGTAERGSAASRVGSRQQTDTALVDRFAQSPQGASHIPANWQPGEDCIKQCRQQGIPEDFIRQQLPGFVMYWRERRQARFSWGNAFYKQVLREWRQEQTRRGASQLERGMSAEWRPSEDAVEILQNAGISATFIEDCVPEFVLYWRERGVSDGAWNSRFIEHIRRQWARYSASLEHDGLPRPIAGDWQPSEACFDILRLAEIDEDYARGKVQEFVLYWRDTRQPHASWNTRFLQYIKFNWAKRLEQLQDTDSHAKHRSFAGPHSEKGGQGLAATFQRFTDRSWAE